jgi:hypothetical protein
MLRLVSLAVFFACAASAGLAEDTSGFEVKSDGFGFQNFGNAEGVTNLTPADMVRMFGPGVNACPGDDEITLTPAAEEWMEQRNAAMGGGHCEGLAVLSYMIHIGQLKASDFGADATNALKLEDNEKLQREIAYWWATQCTDTTWKAMLRPTPNEAVDVLRKSLPKKDPENAYTLGIYMPDHSGGHAITPYAIVDTDDTHSRIMVYDNNYPNEERYVEVDRGANSWKYSTAANPAESANAYTGDATTNGLDLTPCAIRLTVQQSSFIGVTPYSEDDGLEKPSEDAAKPGDEVPDDDEPEKESDEDDDKDGKDDKEDADEKDDDSEKGSTKGSTKGAAPSAAPSAAPLAGVSALARAFKEMQSTASERIYATGKFTMDIALTGHGAELLIKDAKGRRTGYDGGKLVNEIPDAQVLWVKTGKIMGRKKPHPGFRIPGGTDYLITVTGTAEEPEPLKVSCLNRGAELVVEDITIDKGQTDTVFFSQDGSRVSYKPSGDEHPTLIAGYSSKGPDFEITAHGVETDPGATVQLEIIPKTGCAKVEVLDTKDPATVAVEIERMTDEGASTYENDELKLDPNDAAYFHFAAWKGDKAPMSVDIDKGGDGKIDSVSTFADKLLKR